MTDPTPLSPAAQTVLRAYEFAADAATDSDDHKGIAAALRAVADEVVPADYQFHTGKLDLDIGIEDNTATIRGKLLAIAAELESTDG